MAFHIPKDMDFVLYTSYDPAIDREASDLSGYQAGGDTSVLVMREGERPTVFHCRALSQAAMRRCATAMQVSAEGRVSGMADLAEAAFVSGVVQIDELYGPGGNLITIGSQDRVKGEDRLSSAWLKKAGIPHQIVDEIGGLIHRRSQLDAADIKNS